jgi:hypothetical protein
MSTDSGGNFNQRHRSKVHEGFRIARGRRRIVDQRLV